MSDQIRGDIGSEGRQASVGKDIQQVSVYADTHTWRLDVQDRFHELHRSIASLWGWVIGILIAICVISLVVFILSLFAIRQFDWTNLRIESHRDKIQRLEQRVDPPLPFTPLP